MTTAKGSLYRLKSDAAAGTDDEELDAPTKPNIQQDTLGKGFCPTGCCFISVSHHASPANDVTSSLSVFLASFPIQAIELFIR
jgi:hypothetical protein